MYSLASNGVTVIHPRAVLIGKRYNIPIRILSTFKDDHPGTTISSIDSNNKIIGLAIKKQDDDNEIISIIFNKDYKNEIENDLLEFILQENKNIIRIIYSQEKISFIVKSEIVTDFGHKLYNLLIN
jgi:aspartate kinase